MLLPQLMNKEHVVEINHRTWPTITISLPFTTAMAYHSHGLLSSQVIPNNCYPCVFVYMIPSDETTHFKFINHIYGNLEIIG